MLAASIHAGERFLVKNDFQMMLVGHLLHHGHQKHVLIDGLGHLAEFRSALELIRSHLVMPCSKFYAKLISLRLEILHERHRPLRNRSLIMVRELLIFCGSVPDDRPVTEGKIWTSLVKSFIDQEIFLFETYVDSHLGDRIVKKICHRDGSFVQGLVSFQVRHLHINRFSIVGNKDRRYAERLAKDINWGSRVPCGITAGLERIPQSSARKTGTVRFLLDKSSTTESFEDVTIFDSDKSLMLFSSKTSKRFNDVRVMSSAHLYRPGFHARGDFVCQAAVDAGTILASRDHRLISWL